MANGMANGWVCHMSKQTDTWMPLYVGDYLRDTTRLSTEAHGAYLLMLMDYWIKGPPPDDDEVLAAITKLPPQRWAKLKPIIAEFFQVKGGFWHQKRADEEKKTAANHSEKKRAAGKEGAEKRWQTHSKDHSKPIAEPMADAWQTHSSAIAVPFENAQKPIADAWQKPWQTDAPSPYLPSHTSREQCTSSAREAAKLLCEELEIKLENDPERINWPGKIQQWLDRGGVLDDLLKAGKRSRARGDPPGKLGLYLKMSEDEKARREVEEGAYGDVKSPTKDYWLTHAEVRKGRVDALHMYASDGRWVPNELPNGVWGDAFDTGPPPDDPRTKISDELLDSVPGARARRDKILAAAKVAT
jgi:uncharacterized protein YdaU (DUF1376 family)